MGNAVAVRTLNALSVNMAHVREVGARLQDFPSEGHGPIPIWLQALDLKPAMQVMPLIAETVGEQVIPRNLQVRLQNYLATRESESLVKCLAKSLASLHRRQVVHGNLKPSNVFISEEGRVLISDYGLGWMPGLDFLGFSDALLYMSPEQLRDPSGLQREEGYRWDVFAFGVLAYRLLEGRFPRCHESFEDVAPAPGVMHAEGIEADFGGVAEQLFEEEVAPLSRTMDQALKKLVMRCLELEPEKRFRDMVELCEVWEREAQAVRHASEMDVVGAKLRKGRAWKRGLSWGLAASIAAAVTFATFWMTRESTLTGDRKRAEMAADFARKEKTTAEAALAAAEKKGQGLQQRLAEVQNEVVLLSKSREQLLGWSLEEGGHDLPVLVGREGRLKLLDEQYQKLLKEPGVTEDWRKKWQVERALIALARGRDAEARDLVGGEVSQLGGRGLTTLLLRESRSEETSREELAIARNLVKRLDAQPRAWLASALDLVEVRSLERSGQKDRSLRLLAELGEKIGKLPAAVPGTSSLWRTRVHREAADVAEGAGREELSRKFREDMIAELRNDLGAADLREGIREQLVEQFVIVAEGLAEMSYSEGRLADALAFSKEALALLPEGRSDRAHIALAVHHAVIGGCQREAGKTAEAKESLEKGLLLVKELPATSTELRWGKYREGMLKWQLSGVLGQSDDEEGEAKVGQEALAIMRELLEQGTTRPSPIQVHHVIGYLCGDLAQASEALGKRDEVASLLDEAIESWKFLQAANPGDEEYVAGLAWCEQLRQPKTE